MSFLTKRPTFTVPGFDVFSPARSNDERGLIMGVRLDGGNSYTPWIGLSTIRELALKHSARTGLVDATIHAELQEDYEALKQDYEVLQERLADLEATQAAITGLSKQGFRVQKTVGRPAKKREVVNG